MKTFIIDIETKEWAHLETLDVDIVNAIMKEVEGVRWVEIIEKKKDV